MINASNMTYVVNNGDCPWTVAKKNLKARNEKITNMKIIEEMERLAKLNGCDSVDDFGNNFFMSVGLELRLEDKQEVPPEDPIEPTTPTTPTTPDNSVEPTTPLTSEEAEVERINQMDNDADRIIEYNKTHYEGEHYGIVDKKTCELKIYDKDGNVVKTFPVGVGKSKGDNLGSGYNSDDPEKKEGGRYTTPGEFTLDELPNYSNPNYISKKDGKPKVMLFKGDNMGEDAANQGIHMIPNNRSERKHALDTETPDDNRISYGCVNMREEDYDEMAKYLGEGDKVYILPEEDGNKLQLEKQTDGSYKFEQQYHKDQKRGVNKEEASKVDYDVRPDRDPANKKKQNNADELNELLNQLKNLISLNL